MIELINCKQIKPQQRGKSDFFSWQLYRWVKARPDSIEIWHGTWDSIYGTKGNGRSYIGYMGEDGWFHGRDIRSLCRYRERLESYAYGPGHDTANWHRIDPEWWAEYLRIGVCAIWENNAHAWRHGIETRRCEYCGKIERRGVQFVIEQREIWRADSNDRQNPA